MELSRKENEVFLSLFDDHSCSMKAESEEEDREEEEKERGKSEK